jgi:HemY protein
MRASATLILIFLALGGAAGWLLSLDAGYVLLKYNDWVLETSLIIAVSALLLILVLFYTSLRLILNLLTPGGRLGRWLGGRRQRSVELQTHLGMLAYLEGNWDRAVRLLSRSADKSNTPQLNYLIAARASQASGEVKQSQDYLDAAQQDAGKANIAIALTQAELQMQSGKLEESLATLTRIKKQAPKHVLVIALLQKLYQQLGDWQALAKLLPEIEKYQVVDGERLSELQQDTYRHWLQVSARDGDQALIQIWSKVPKQLKRQPAILKAYAEALKSAGNQAEAEKALRIYLKKDWDNDLVVLFGELRGNDPGKQLILAESWLRERPNNASLFLCLGRLALMNNQNEKAKEYLQASVKLETNARAYAQLAQLLHAQGDEKASLECYQRAFEQSTVV